MEYADIISDWNDLPSDKKLLFGKKWAVRNEDMQGWDNTFENLPSLKQRVVLGSKEDIEILKNELIKGVFENLKKNPTHRNVTLFVKKLIRYGSSGVEIFQQYVGLGWTSYVVVDWDFFGEELSQIVVNACSNRTSQYYEEVILTLEHFEEKLFEEIYKNLNPYTCIKVGDYLISVDLKAEISGKGYRVDLERNSLGIIDDDSFYNNDGFALATGYLPLSEKAEELNLPLLPNPFKKEESVEELANQVFKEKTDKLPVPTSYWKNEVENYKNFWIEGYNSAKPKQFSLEDVKKAFNAGQKHGEDNVCNAEVDLSPNLGEYLQSLSDQQLPKRFTPEYINENVEDSNGERERIRLLKTRTNSDGEVELVGVYKF